MRIIQYCLLFLAFFISINLSAQSKRQLERQLESTQNKVEQLENELSQFRTRFNKTNENLSNTLEANAHLTNVNAELTSTNTSLLQRINQEKRYVNMANRKIDSLERMVKLLQIDSDFITNPRNEQDSILATLQPFYAARIWEDRLDYILQPNKLKSKMAVFYDNYPMRSIIKSGHVTYLEKDSTDLNLRKVGIGNNIIYLRKEKNAYKIDWEASFGSNSMAADIFKKTTSTTPEEFRVMASLSNSYLAPFNNKKQTHWSLDLKTIYPEESFQAYVAKDSEEGQALHALLEDGKTHRVLLKMVKNQEDRTEKVTEITEFIQEDWSKKQ